MSALPAERLLTLGKSIRTRSARAGSVPPRLRSGLACGLVLLLLQGPLAPAHAEGPALVARGVDGKEVRAALAKLEGWSLKLADGAGAFGPAEWLGFRQAGKALPDFPADEHLVLGNGDRVPARDVRVEGEKVFFRHPDLGGGKEVPLPLSAVAVLWRQAPDATPSPEALRRRLLRGERPRDVVLLRNGDTLEGTLQAVRGGQVEVEANKKPVTARWPQVAAVALSSELLDRLRPKGAHARVVLAEAGGSPGGRLTITEASSDGKALVGKTAFGAELSVPLARVLSLERAGGDIVELADLEPSGYNYSPYLDEKWRWTRDAAVTGRDLRLGGSAYTRGVGMHASSRLTYALNGAYRRFDALAGLDDRDGRKGRVKLRVLVDGKPAELTRKGLWAHADGALRVSADVAGAKELTLEVLAGPDGPMQAVVDWIDPRLVK